MNKYSFLNCEDDAVWDNLIASSINKNIFCTSLFLKSLEKKVKRFLIKNNEEIIGGIILNDDQKELNLNNELLYTPLIFKGFGLRPRASQNNEKFYLIDSLKNFLINNFKKISFISDYHLDDLRPFFFHNFDKKNNFFKITKVNYTSIINLDEIDNSNFEKTTFFSNLAVRIRQDYRYSLTKKKFKIIENFQKENFERLIEETFKRQKIKPDFDHKKRSKILEKLSKDRGVKMYQTYEGNKVKAFSVFGYLKNHAIYLHGARIEDDNKDYSLTYSILEAIKDLKKNGVKTLDLEGINSPRRGFNKIGYGGKIFPYYHIEGN